LNNGTAITSEPGILIDLYFVEIRLSFSRYSVIDRRTSTRLTM
jgi:hypothetical protein